MDKEAPKDEDKNHAARSYIHLDLVHQLLQTYTVSDDFHNFEQADDSQQPIESSYPRKADEPVVVLSVVPIAACIGGIARLKQLQGHDCEGINDEPELNVADRYLLESHFYNAVLSLIG